MSRTDPGSEPPSPHQCPSPSGSHQWALPRDVDEVWGAVPQEAFASLVPKVVHSRVTEQGEVREQLLECCGAVIVVDVSGFSSITSRLRKAGADSAEGVEVLSDELNKYYKGIVDSINDAGGDIVSFSGDNILAVWEAHENNSPLRQRRALLRAVSCATALAGATHRIALIKAQLSLHIGVSMGAYKLAVVGGRGTLGTGRWRVALVGDALREAAQAANVASRGEVALPAAVADQLNVAYPSLTLREKQDDFYLIFAAELAAAKRTASEGEAAAGSLNLVPALFEPGQPTEPDTPLEPRAPDSSCPESAFAKCEGPYQETQKERNLAVASFALDAVAYILSGQTYGELRKVATVCVRLSALSEATAFGEDTSARDFERLNKAVGIVQRGLLASEGILNKVVLDDQGLTVQCLFGLPRHTHEDDAGRAVSFAVKVAPKLLPLTGDVCIGISRAKVYCGLTGSAVRREYAVIGEGVNIASALMMEAVRRMPPGADTLILTDEATKSTALVPTLLHTLNVAFRSSLQLMHKGQQEPSPVYAIESAECSDSGDVMTSVGVALEALDDSPHHQGQVHSQNKSRAKRGKLARGPSLDEWSPHTSQNQRSPQASHNPRTAQKSNTVKRTSSRKVIVGQRPRQGSATSTSSSKSPHSRSRRGIGSGDWDPTNPSKQVTTVPGSRQKLFGRVNEITALVHLVHGCSRKMSTALSENRRERDAVTCVYIKGDVQMGKTSLLLAASEMATSLTVPFAMIKGSEMSVSTPYVPLVPLVTSFIETTPIQFIEMGFHPHELRPYFPLLHHIVRIPNLAQPSEEQAAMKPSEKGHFINQILLALLRKFYGERCLVLIDDVQWLDNMTLSFARELITGGWRVAMTSRSSSKLAQHGDLTRMSSLTKTRSYASHASYASDSSDELRFEAACDGDVVEAESRAFDAAVAGHPTLQQYKLAPLSARMSAELCCDVFQSTRLSCEVELLVFRKSVGRPGFAKQIAAALAAARLVVVQDGVALFPRGAKDCTETIVHAVPAVEAQIMQFMDTLPDYHKVVAMMLAFLGPVRLRVLEVCVFEHSGSGPFRAALAFLQTLSLIHRSTQTELAEVRRHTANGLGGNDADVFPLASSSTTVPALAASGTDSGIQRRGPPPPPASPSQAAMGADTQLFGRLSVSNGPLEGSLSIGKALSSSGLSSSLILKDGKVALPRPDNDPTAQCAVAAAAAGSASGRGPRARSKSVVVAAESDNDEVAFTLPLSGDVLYFSCMAKTKKRFHSVVVSALVGCASFPNEQFSEHCTRSAVPAEELRAAVRKAFYAGKARDDLASCLAAVSRQGAFEHPGRLHGSSLLLASLLYECGHTTGAAAALRRLHPPDTTTDLAAMLQPPPRSSPFSCCCGGGSAAAADPATGAAATAATRAKGPHRLPVSIMLECQFLVLQLETDLWGCKVAEILRTKKKLETLCGHFPDGELDLGGLLLAVQRVVQEQGEPPPPAVDAPSQPSNDGDLSAQLYPVRAAGGSGGFAAAGHNPLYQRVVRGSGGGAARAAARTASLSSDSALSPPSGSGASAQSDVSPSSQSPASFTPRRKSLASTLACSDVGSPAPVQPLKPGLFYSPYVLISTCMSWECLRVLDRVNRQSTFAASRAASPVTSTRSRGRTKSVLGGDCTTPQTSYFGGKLFLMPVPTLQERIMERINEELLEPERLRRSASITGAFEASFSFGSRRRLREQSLRAATSVGLLNPPACEARARAAAAASLKGGDAADSLSPASSLAQPVTPVDTSAPQFLSKEAALPVRGLPAGGLLRHSLKQTSVLLLSAAAVLTGESVGRLNPEYFAGVDEAVVWPHMEYVCKLSSILSFVEVSAGSVAQAERVAVRACSDGADATERLLHHAFHTLGRARNGVYSPDLPAALAQVHACGGLITPVHVVGLWALSEAVEIYRELHVSNHVADLCSGGAGGGDGDERPRLTAVGSGESLLSTACASRDSGFSDDPTLDDLDAYQQLLRALLEKASASYPIVLPAYHFALGCAQGVGARERRGHLVAVLEACQALWVPHCAPASAAGGFPYDFYCHDRECDSHVVTDLTSSQFGAEFSVQVGKKLMLVDYDMRVDNNGKTLVSGVYKENYDSRSWLAKRGMSTATFAIENSKQKSKGRRLIDLEYYKDGSSWRVAAIWVQNKEGRAYKYQLGVSVTEYYNKLNSWKGSYVPVDVDIYEKDGSLRYNTVWCQKKSGDKFEWKLHTNMARSTYNDKVQAYPGFVVTDYESARIGGSQRYAALFYKASDAKIGAYKWRTDVTASQLSQLLDEQDDLGRRVVEIEAYRYGSSSVRYGATWWENDRSKTRWSKKGTVDGIVQNYVSSNSITGVSVTVVKDGVEKYSRGFGKSNVAAGVAATTHTIYRLASVSKGIGAVLASLLEQKGKINLDAPAKPLIDASSASVTLPNSHSYTVRQTMTHRSGLRHYISGDNVWDDSNPTYTTAAAALPMLPYSTALVNSVGSTYRYSTHAYTFTAAALEGATGKSITRLVREYLRDGQGVSSLAAEHEAATRAKRSKLYKPDGTLFTEKDDLSWKVLGGGLEASSKDLGAFFDRLQRNKILTSSNLAAMFNVPDSKTSYGTGFVRTTIDGARAYTKSGAQDGASSYVIMAPTKGYSIVVLINQRNGLADNIAWDIARALW